MIKKYIIRLGITAVALYTLSILILYFFQAKIIFIPTTLDQKHEFKLKVEFSEHFLESSTGDKIHYLKLPNKSSNSVVLYFHGNAGALDSWAYFAQKLQQKLSTEVWIMDYPGFGKSSPNIVNSGQDLVTIGKELLSIVKSESPGKKVFLFGRSLGSGIASEVASTETVDGVILETPFYSVKARAKELYPIAPTFILKYNLDNSKLKDSNVENILVFYGEKDQMIPKSHPERLKEIYPKSAKFIEISEGGHNGLPTYAQYWKELSQFFQELGERNE